MWTESGQARRDRWMDHNLAHEIEAHLTQGLTLTDADPI
jgi:hypothetical protein